MLPSPPPYRPLIRVLVLRLSSIGDVVLTTPFLRRFHWEHPACEIHYVTRAPFAQLVEHHPAIHTLHVLPADPTLSDLLALRSRLVGIGFDVVFDLHNNLRTRVLRWRLARDLCVVHKRTLPRAVLVRLHRDWYRDEVPVAERYIETAAPYGVEPDGDPPDLVVPDDIVAAMQARIASDHAPGHRIAICAGAKHFTKRWPAEHLAELCAMLIGKSDVTIHFFGGKEDAAQAAVLCARAPERMRSHCGELTLLETAAALSQCDVALTMDSGLMHIATARRVPVVAIFGSTVRQFGFFPYNAQARVVEASDVECRPCSHIGRSSCPKGHFRCMREILPSTIFPLLT